MVEIGQKELYDIESLMKKLLLTSEMAIDTYDSGFGVCFYDKEVEARISREDDIKHALSQIASQEKDAVLFLQYQPFLNLKTNSICGFEALARIDSTKLGRISPLEFIPIAEETKLIIPLGSQIFQQAFTFHNKLCALGYGHMSLSVNVSVIQLLKRDFCEKLLELLKAMQVDPKKISLEITESVFSADYSKINGILTKLKAEGLHISIDDFGTGYSSLARERDLAVDSLKIDKSFIDRLLRVHPDNAITAEIIAMAHKMGHCTVAEGVEFEEQRAYLEQHGCDEIQGYLISRPLDEEAAFNLLLDGGNPNAEN